MTGSMFGGATAYQSGSQAAWRKWVFVGFLGLLVLYMLLPSSQPATATTGGEGSSGSSGTGSKSTSGGMAANSLRGGPGGASGAAGTARLSELIGVSVELSELASEEIRIVKKAGQEAEHVKIKGQTLEGVDEPVTEADAKANAVFVNGLRQRFPGIHILSEETEPAHKDVPTKATGADVKLVNDPVLNLDEVLITVDPLDATKEFTEDLLNYVTTMICVTHNGRPVAGIINQPFEENSMVYAVVPEVAQGRGVVVGATPKPAEGDKANMVTVSRSHTGAAMDIVKQYLPGKESLPAGGAGYKGLLVLNGDAEAYVHVTKIKVWDVCAAEVIVRAAGGRFTDRYGYDLYYDRDNVAINNGLTGALTPRKHAWYIDHLASMEETN